MQSQKLEERPSRRGPGSIAAGIFLSILIALPVILAVSAAVYYILGPAEGYFHADCSDSLYWANASLESGSVFDKTYNYAALLPFSANLWMTPLIAAFGFGMTAQNIGMIIFVLVFCASLIYFCRKAGMSIGWCSLTTGIVLMILASSDKLREIMLGHVIYYSLGLVLFFLMAGLSLSVTERGGRLLLLPAKDSPVKSRVMFVLAVVLLFAVSAGSATDGTQMLVLATLPALGGIAAECFFDGKKGLFSRKNTPTGIVIVTIIAGTLCGTLLLKFFTREGITAGYTNVYSTYSDIGSWVSNAQKFSTDYLKLLGVSAKQGENLFSLESFMSLIRLATGILLLVLPVVMLCFYRRIAYRGTRVMLWSHIILSAALFFGYICGRLSNANWRLTPLIGSAAVLAVFAAWELSHAGREKMLRAAVSSPTDEAADSKAADEHPAESGRVLLRSGIILAVFLSVTALVSFGEIAKMPADYGRNNMDHQLAEFLEENELEYGYANFWRSNAITVLTDSRVKVRHADVSATEGLHTNWYQSSSRWYYEDQHEKYDRYFVLLSASDYATVSRSASWREWVDTILVEKLEYEDYYIFVFSEDLDLVEKSS